MRAALALAAALLAASCGPAKGDTVWSVHDKSGKEVLRMKDAPGPIVSRAALPPGAEPARHPFLTASSLDALAENDLKLILDEASSFQDFVIRLAKAGYTVKKSQGTP
jgi:hypothetical protein